MKTFVVNLDKNVVRMAFMHEQLCRLKVDYERLPAVYGKSLSIEERKSLFSAFRSFLAMGVRLSDGEIGCALSHCEIYRRMDMEHLPIVLVLEDDVEIGDGLRQELLEIESFADVASPQVFLLSSHAVKEKKSGGIERIHGGTCTDGYVITLPAARLIRKANYPVVTVADRWRRWERRFGVKMYRVWPTVVRQKNETFGTDISNNLRTAPIGVRKFLYKCVRAFEVFVDWLWYCVTGR